MFSTPAAARVFSQENSDLVARKPNTASNIVSRKPFGDRRVNSVTPDTVKKSLTKQPMKKQPLPIKEDKDDLTIYDGFYHREFEDNFFDIYSTRGQVTRQDASTILRSQSNIDGRKTPDPDDSFLNFDEDVMKLPKNTSIMHKVELFKVSEEDVSLPDFDNL